MCKYHFEFSMNTIWKVVKYTEMGKLFFFKFLPLSLKFTLSLSKITKHLGISHPVSYVCFMFVCLPSVGWTMSMVGGVCFIVASSPELAVFSIDKFSDFLVDGFSDSRMTQSFLEIIALYKSFSIFS